MSDQRYGLFIDYEFCTGCKACITACKVEHGNAILRFHGNGKCPRYTDLHTVFKGCGDIAGKDITLTEGDVLVRKEGFYIGGENAVCADGAVCIELYRDAGIGCGNKKRDPYGAHKHGAKQLYIKQDQIPPFSRGNGRHDALLYGTRCLFLCGKELFDSGKQRVRRIPGKRFHFR